MPDIRMSWDDQTAFRTVLARSYPEGPAVWAILDDIGFPVEHRPSMKDEADLIWRAVFRELDRGLLPQGYRALLRVALNRYATNDILLGLAHRYAPDLPPADAKPPPVLAVVDAPSPAPADPRPLPADPAPKAPISPPPGRPPTYVRAPEDARPGPVGGRLLEIRILAEQAMVDCRQEGVARTVPWHRSRTAVEQAGKVLRESLEALRQKHSRYLDAITPEQLREGLDEVGARVDPFSQRPDPFSQWSGSPSAGDTEAWATISVSAELRSLAHAGHQLYRALFPANEEVWSVLDGLAPGDRLHVSWQSHSSAWVPHLPLPLLYRQPPPAAGDPVDPGQFLGLRLRVGYNAYPALGSRPLGPWRQTTRASLLYWGDAPGDAVGEESRRHHDELRRWDPWTPMPGGAVGQEELNRFLDRPGPSPVSLLYLYCQSGSGTGSGPLLRLGSTNRAEDQLTQLDLGTGPLDDRPVAFLNACGTTMADPQFGNALADLFLSRGCRSYIGTEAKVPAGLAARFATALFFFLFQCTWESPTPVTDAMAAARRFLWDRYGNPGGLFYSHINDEPLVALADDRDVDR